MRFGFVDSWGIKRLNTVTYLRGSIESEPFLPEARVVAPQALLDTSQDIKHNHCLKLSFSFRFDIISLRPSSRLSPGLQIGDRCGELIRSFLNDLEDILNGICQVNYDLTTVKPSTNDRVEQPVKRKLSYLCLKAECPEKSLTPKTAQTA